MHIKVLKTNKSLPFTYCKIGFWSTFTLAISVFISGCAAPPAPPEKKYLNVRIAARNAAESAAEQLKHAGWRDGAVWVAPAINHHSGEITASGRELQVLMAMDLKILLGDAVIQSLGGEENTKWDWILAPSVNFEKPTGKDSGSNWFKVKVSIVSPKGKSLSGVVVRVNANQFDATPSRFFRDAPIYLTGNYNNIRTEFAKGEKSTASLEDRNRFIAVEGMIQESILNFESGDYKKAIQGFDKVIAKDPENLPALSGRYQSLIEVGSATEVENALVKMIAAALKQKNISFRFLFQVRSVEFRDDNEITRHYHSWLNQLAKQVFSAGHCLQVRGHTSRSGSFEYNNDLSYSRANQVMNLMLKYESGLKGRIKIQGRGYQDNVIGSGTDDANDAIDRRVDFKLLSCKNF